MPDGPVGVRIIFVIIIRCKADDTTVILQIGPPSKTQDEVQDTELVLEFSQMLVKYVVHDQYLIYGG